MTVNLIKLCVGVESVEQLAEFHAARLEAQRLAGEQPQLFHRTRMMPKRRDELLDGGSLYWVVKGVILLRQKITGLEEGAWDGGRACSVILLDPEHHLVVPAPRRPFQGWRYLETDDAPADLSHGKGDGVAQMSLEMRRELAELGLL